jgi:hypothetical protein
MQASRSGKDKRDKLEEALGFPHAHLIRIPSKEAMNRAVVALGEVRVPYCGFSESRLLVATEHVAALRKEGIPFEQLS